MPKKYFKPPKEVIKEWPEVFEEIYMQSMPIKYINGVELTFHDGRVWVVDIAEGAEFNHEDEIIDRLSDSIRNFQEEISSVNFQVDIDRMKQDIINSTQNFLGDS